MVDACVTDLACVRVVCGRWTSANAGVAKQRGEVRSQKVESNVQCPDVTALSLLNFMDSTIYNFESDWRRRVLYGE